MCSPKTKTHPEVGEVVRGHLSLSPNQRIKCITPLSVALFLQKEEGWFEVISSWKGSTESGSVNAQPENPSIWIRICFIFPCWF